MTEYRPKIAGLHQAFNGATADGHFPSMSQIVNDLCCPVNTSGTTILGGHNQDAMPSRDLIIKMVEALRAALFPGYFGVSDVSRESKHFHVGAALDGARRILVEQIRRGLCFSCKTIGDNARCAVCEEQSIDTTNQFLAKLPEIQKLLATDVLAAFEGDPAATSPDEAIFCYPGVHAITNYRIAHELHVLGAPLIARIISEQAHSVTGIDIHPGATIGEKLFIDHGTGVVIGETCVIGKRVRIYQGVTLGAKSFPLDANGNPIKGIRRHPTVEDDVIIYSGATILGNVTIGEGAVIGGNVWLTRSIPPGSKITQAQVRQDRFEDGGGI